MSLEYFLFALVLLAVAVLMRSDYIMTLLYLLAGVLIIGRWWSRRSLLDLVCQREFEPRAFLGEAVPVSLTLRNRGWLPLPWLRIHESLPVELGIEGQKVSGGHFKQILSLGARGQATLHYRLRALRRGYYPVGPLFTTTGDLLGLSEHAQVVVAAGHLTVYPQIVPLTHVALPSRSPMGSLRYHRPIFEDTARVMGKRDYVAGDSLRRIDWKTSAALGRLQVRQYEPSIALETVIFLNLHSSEYELHTWRDATELGIVLAASLANWVIGKKQAAGLVSNGLDPLATEQGITHVPAGKGRGHLMRVLDVLARVQATDKAMPMVDTLRQQAVHLSWGTTVILITARLETAEFDQLFHLRRKGMEVVLVVAGWVAGAQALRQSAEHFGFPIYFIRHEAELHF